MLHCSFTDLAPARVAEFLVPSAAPDSVACPPMRSDPTHILHGVRRSGLLPLVDKDACTPSILVGGTDERPLVAGSVRPASGSCVAHDMPLASTLRNTDSSPLVAASIFAALPGDELLFFPSPTSSSSHPLFLYSLLPHGMHTTSCMFALRSLHRPAQYSGFLLTGRLSIPPYSENGRAAKHTLKPDRGSGTTRCATRGLLEDVFVHMQG